MATTNIRVGVATLVVAWIALGWAGTVGGGEPQTTAAPTAEEICQLLKEQPISADTWPFWRERYLQWYYDRGGTTREADEQLAAFMGGQFKAQDKTLAGPFAEDAAAWLVLVHFYLRDKNPDDVGQRLEAAEVAGRRALELAPNLAAGHSALASVLVYETLVVGKAIAPASKDQRLAEAEREMARAAELSATFRPVQLRGLIAFSRGQFTAAKQQLQQAMEDYPHSEGTAVWYMQAVFALNQPGARCSESSGPLVERFPNDGTLRALHAGALSHDGKFAEAAQALERASQLGKDPRTVLGAATVQGIQQYAEMSSPALELALEAMQQKMFLVAEQQFRQALETKPDRVELARYLATALVARQGTNGSGGRVADEIGGLCRRFPEDSHLPTFYAVALAREKRFAESAAAIQRAKQLGGKPAELLGDETIRQIDELSRPGLIMQFLHIMGWFAAAYAVIMLLMAVAGMVLTAITPRVPAPPLGVQFGHGDMVISGRESWLARLYMFVLVIGLILFYVSVPFVTAGLVAATGAVLYLVFLLPRIPVQLLVIVLFTGLGMAWAVLRSVFASQGRGSFGLRKTESDCPRLINAIRDVAGRTETTPMDEVYLAPGAAIGVHQEGRGPFGMFGVKRRVLTLGLSTMSVLTVSELNAILAHEYAHFSHRDTFYSRFIQQVTLSIAQALGGMGAAGGKLNYVNPFFWFFWLYYHAYSLLASGFSRSREFLADRMAVSLYGKEAFIASLTKVATDGTLFENSIYQLIDSLLAEGKAFENMYVAFREFRDRQISPEDRQKMYRSLLEEKLSWFATHPTFTERLRAVIPYPDVPPQETQSALELFDDPAEIEKELTNYLTSYMAMLQQMRQQATVQSY